MSNRLIVYIYVTKCAEIWCPILLIMTLNTYLWFYCFLAPQNTKECRDGKLFNLSNTKISMAFCQSPSEKKPRQQVIKRAIYADN